MYNLEHYTYEQIVEHIENLIGDKFDLKAYASPDGYSEYPDKKKNMHHVLDWWLQYDNNDIVRLRKYFDSKKIDISYVIFRSKLLSWTYGMFDDMCTNITNFKRRYNYVHDIEFLREIVQKNNKIHDSFQTLGTEETGHGELFMLYYFYGDTAKSKVLYLKTVLSMNVDLTNKSVMKLDYYNILFSPTVVHVVNGELPIDYENNDLDSDSDSSYNDECVIFKPVE